MNFATKFIEEQSVILVSEKQKWEEEMVELGADKNVIRYISDIRFHGAPAVSVEDSIETIRHLFEAGYCYYFAKALEIAFPGGKVCLCYPYGHIVYVYNKIAYDINGISDAEYGMYIPVEQLGTHINDFLHIPSDRLEERTSEDNIDELGERCVKEKLFVEAENYYTLKNR